MNQDCSPTRPRAFAALALLVGLCAALSGCESTTAIRIYPDQTYTLHATMGIPKNEGSQITCASLQNLLLEAGGQGQTRVLDRSTVKQTRCTIDFTKPQPIASSGAPFVTIKHYSGRYSVSLPGDPSYSNLNENTRFKLSLTFPGPITDTSGAAGGKVDGDTITWTNPKVLNTGFEVEARDNAGFSLSQVLIWALMAALLMLALGMSRALGRPDSFQKMRRRWRAFWIPTRTKIFASTRAGKAFATKAAASARDSKASRSALASVRRGAKASAEWARKTGKAAVALARRGVAGMRRKDIRSQGSEQDPQPARSEDDSRTAQKAGSSSTETSETD